MSDITFLVYSEDPEKGQALASLIESTAHGHVIATVCDAQDLGKRVDDLRPCALLALLGEDPHVSLDSVGVVHGQVPALYVCGPQDDSSLLLRALKLGAKEYFPPKPAFDELDGAIESQFAAMQNAPQPTGEKKDAPIIAVMGAKGGVGATFVACELSAKLQRMGRRTAIVDLNYPLGDVAVHFDLRPRYTLAGILGQGDDLDATYVCSLLAEHRSGLRVLASPEHVEETELVTGDHVAQVLGHLRQEVDFIVVDASRSWNDASVRAFDLADEIVLVTSSDLAALAHTRQHLDLLSRLGHGGGKVHVVANRRSAGDAVTDADFAKFLERPIDLALPNDYPTALESSNSGRTLDEFAPDAELTLAFGRFAREAHAWCGVPLMENDSLNDNSLSGKFRRLLGR